MPKHLGTGRIAGGFHYVKDTLDYRQRIAVAVILAIAVVTIVTILLTASASASGPDACTVGGQEDSQLVNCDTGQPLTFHDGAWWGR